MPVDLYRVVKVPPGAYDVESRGAKEKFWLRLGDDERRWLLKFPRPGTGEHWAEKIAAEVGRLIEVNAAQVELALYEERQATICRSFERRDSELTHGSEIMADAIRGYDVDTLRGNIPHNVQNIVGAIRQIGSLDDKNGDSLLSDLASYALLDGLVGNTDRHHENWMVYIRNNDHGVRVEVAPSFDHASSLGRELQDSRRMRILSSDGVLNYLNRGRGGVYAGHRRRTAPSPLRLAQLLCRWNSELRRDWFRRLGNADDNEFRAVIDRVPSGFMSDAAKDFARQVLIASKMELLRSMK